MKNILPLKFLDFEKSLAKLSIEDDDKGQIFEVYVELFLKPQNNLI